jgi:predicted flap endonuclease-1-like 5' DNA nuclease
MKTYADNLDYQGFMSALEEAKNVFEATKAKTKEIKAFFKTAKKEDAPKNQVYGARFEFRQAKLKQKFEHLALRVAKLNLKGFVESFKLAQKEEAKAAKKAEASEKETAKKAASSHTDMIDKPSSKVSKSQKSIKVTSVEGELAPAVVETKKAAKVKDAKKAAKKQAVEVEKVVKVKAAKKHAVEVEKVVKVKATKKHAVEVEKVVKVKATKKNAVEGEKGVKEQEANVVVAKTQVAETPEMAEVTMKTTNVTVTKNKVAQSSEMPEGSVKTTNVTVTKKQVAQAPEMAEITVKAVENTPITTQSVGTNEVVILKRTPINDLTIIEGIGPKVAKILYDKGVKNFKTLIASPVEDIKTWLKENKLQFIDPTTWAEQAKLADEGKMVEFEDLKKTLKASKRV